MYVCIRYFKALDFVSNNFLANIHQYWMCVFKLSVYMFSLCTHFLGAIFSLGKKYPCAKFYVFCRKIINVFQCFFILIFFLFYLIRDAPQYRFCSYF